MASQFDEIAKVVARGMSRRRALRGLLGGIAGAVVASLWASGKAPSAEAVHEGTASPSLQQPPKPKWNQTVWNQTKPRVNQRFNQARAGLNQRLRWNQQARINALRARFNQQHSQIDHEPRPRRNNAGANQVRPGWNQQRLHLNQTRFPLNQSGGGPTLNMVRGPHFDPRKRP
jgi:hypothetical protein